MRGGAAIRHCAFEIRPGTCCPRVLAYGGRGRPRKWCDEHRVVVRREAIRLAVRATRRRQSSIEAIARRVSKRLENIPDPIAGCFRRLGPGTVADRFVSLRPLDPATLLDSLVHPGPLRRVLREGVNDVVLALRRRSYLLVQTARPLWPSMTNRAIRQAAARYMRDQRKAEQHEEQKRAESALIVQAVSRAIAGLPTDVRALISWTRPTEQLLARLIARGTGPMALVSVLLRRPHVHRVAESDPDLFGRFIREGLSALVRASETRKRLAPSVVRRRVAHLDRCLSFERRQLSQERTVPQAKGKGTQGPAARDLTESAQKDKARAGASARSTRNALRAAR